MQSSGQERNERAEKRAQLNERRAQVEREVHETENGRRDEFLRRHEAEEAKADAMEETKEEARESLQAENELR